MKDYGIFEVQKDDEGHFQVTEQLTGDVRLFLTIEEVKEYIAGVLEEVEADEED